MRPGKYRNKENGRIYYVSNVNGNIYGFVEGGTYPSFSFTPGVHTTHEELYNSILEYIDE